MIGRHLSHFRILEPMGAGGMGVVYRAVDVELGRPVAIKVLAEGEPGGGSQPRRRERLVNEARAASALNHPGIVTIHEIGAAEGCDFIVMELVEGRPLHLAIPPRGLDRAQILAWGREIAEALASAHERGVIHRDLKPANVMITLRDRVKILDFGLAMQRRVAQATADAAELQRTVTTVDGPFLGTPQYMSPEQVEGRPVDGRSDLFSFGCVLYEMATGCAPFRGENRAQVVSAILREVPPPLSACRPDLPRELGRIVAKALEKELDYRYQHAEDLLADLLALARDSAAPARSAGPGPVLSAALLGAGAFVFARAAAHWRRSRG